MTSSCVPDGLVVRIRRSHRRGRGSIPRLGEAFFSFFFLYLCDGLNERISIKSIGHMHDMAFSLSVCYIRICDEISRLLSANPCYGTDVTDLFCLRAYPGRHALINNCSG